jgi:hypothetical protein
VTAHYCNIRYTIVPPLSTVHLLPQPGRGPNLPFSLSTMPCALPHRGPGLPRSAWPNVSVTDVTVPGLTGRGPHAGPKRLVSPLSPRLPILPAYSGGNAAPARRRGVARAAVRQRTLLTGLVIFEATAACRELRRFFINRGRTLPADLTCHCTALYEPVVSLRAICGATYQRTYLPVGGAGHPGYFLAHSELI